MKEYILNRIGELNLRHAQLQSEATNIERPFGAEGEAEYNIKMSCAAEIWNTIKELQGVLDNAPVDRYFTNPSDCVRKIWVYAGGHAFAEIVFPDGTDMELTITKEKLEGLTLFERYQAILLRADTFIKCSLSQPVAQLNTGGDGTVQG